MSVRSTSISITVYRRVEYVLTIEADRLSCYEGESVAFSGVLSYNEELVSGATVKLYRNGVEVGSATTDPWGRWSLDWLAEVEGTFTFYAEAVLGEGLRVRSFI